MDTHTLAAYMRANDVAGNNPQALLRGLVALQPIAKGEDIIALPNSCTAFDASAAREDKDLGRGLHSSTFQLNLSAVYGIGCVRGGCVSRVIRGC